MYPFHLATYKNIPRWRFATLLSEHVELYASIKGINKDCLKEAVSGKLAEVGLSEKDSDRLCSNYSGGMKRRLSLACATIGQPELVYVTWTSCFVRLNLDDIFTYASFSVF